MCSGFVMASNTSSRGASKSRVMRISRSDGKVILNESLFAAGWLANMGLLLGFQMLQICVERVEAPLPEDAIALGPLGDFLDRSGLQPARPPLRFPSARDEARA